MKNQFAVITLDLPDLIKTKNGAISTLGGCQNVRDANTDISGAEPLTYILIAANRRT